MKTKYDLFYTHDSKDSFHGKPNPYVNQLLQRLKLNKSGEELRLLDIAAGDGRHTVPAAEQEIYVDCIEISKGGVEILEKRLKSRSLNKYVNITCGDMLDFEFMSNKYNAVIFIDAIHFITNSPISTYVGKIQSSTKIGGENLITFLTDTKLDGNPYQNRIRISPKEAKELLRELYFDWDVEFYPDKELRLLTDEVNEKNCLYTATRISMIAKKIK